MKILDCTLRDGGYINNWNFSEGDIKGIIKYLHRGKLDFIELGYLSQTQEKRGTIFSNIEEVKKLNIPFEKKILMINYNEFNQENIPKNNEYVFGIRVVFKKSQWREAVKYSKELSEKGYNIFLQPMQTVMYRDKEILDLIEEVNKGIFYALYIVDSFGQMKKEDLLRIISLYSHNLNKKIKIGFHSHNNLQLSFALAIEFLNINIKHEKIVDSSVYGMGRGAGNLNTELFLEYLNQNYNTDYNINDILKIMDLYLEKIYQKEKWGYNLGHFISAKLGCHPNFATYLLEKRNLGVEGIKNILNKIPEGDKVRFNEKLIEDLYLEYQNNFNKDKIVNVKKIKWSKNILLVAPGISVIANNSEITKFIKETKELTVISLNHKNISIESNYLFFTNEKRLAEYNENFRKNDRIIVTSNIRSLESVDYIFDYEKYSHHGVESFSSDIFFNILYELDEVETVYLAGMDGFFKNKKNYIFETTDSEKIDELNKKIGLKIKNSNKNIKFLTESIYMEEL